MAQAIALFVIAILTTADQLLKLLVEVKLKPVGSIDVMANVFQLRYVENTGAAFSLLAGKTYLLAAFTAVAIAVGIFALMTKRIKSKYLFVCITLIIAGGFGNLIDRVFRGYVIDYLEFLFVNFAVFNFADCLVTVGAVLTIGNLVWDMIQDSKKKKGERE